MAEKSVAGATYVRFVLDHLKLSPSALAKKAGISSTTLTRMLNDPDYKFTVSLSTLEKISAATSIPYVPFFEARDSSELAQASLRGIIGNEFFDHVESAAITPIIGKVAAGVWYEIDAPRYPTLRYLPLKMATNQDENAFAMEVNGKSVNEIADHGDYLICERFNEGANTYNGDIVIVETLDKARGLIEITAKRIERLREKWIYTFPTGELKFRGIIAETPLSRPFNDPESGIRAIGAVRFAVKRVPALS